MAKSLVIGSCGQIGVELVLALGEKIGESEVVASDIRDPHPLLEGRPFRKINAMDKDDIQKTIEEEGIEDVYLLAAMLSATAEKFPDKGWDLNMTTLFHCLDLAKEGRIKKLFWPSSIAVFGPNTPKVDTPQHTVMEPSTVYGISKQSGERWCQYYHEKYGVDVRSVRYPGLISYRSEPGGGTTDYAIDIFHSAKKGETFSCFLAQDSALPMMYMDDAIRATIELMHASPEDVKVRSSYNIASLSFTPEQLHSAIASKVPGFEIEYNPDYRQQIASSWPASIDDQVARVDWGWKHEFDLDTMVDDMLANV